MGILTESQFKRINLIVHVYEAAIKLCGTDGTISCVAAYLACNSIFISITSISGKINLSCLDGGKCVSFHFPYNSEAVQVQVIVSAEDAGARNMSPYDMYSHNNTPGIMRSVNIIFNYTYYNNMLQRTEVTENFSCPFCLMKCASYKGLRFHLTSSHDLFPYEFWVCKIS